MQFVAVAGLPGSGKTTVAKIVEKRGYVYMSMGDVVRAVAQKTGMTPDKVAVFMRLEKGRRAVVNHILETAKGERFVIDGLRSPEELDALEEVGKTFLIYVVASKRTRYTRLYSRGRSDDPLTYSQFLMRDLRELKFGLADLLARADYIVVNENKTIEQLEEELSLVI